MSNPQGFPLPGSPKDSQKYKPLFRIILGASGLVLLAATVLFLKYDSRKQKPEPVMGGFGSTPTLVSPADVALEMTSQNQPEVVISTSTLIPTETPFPTVTPTELPVLNDQQLLSFGADLQMALNNSKEVLAGNQTYVYDQEEPYNKELMDMVKKLFLSLDQGVVPNLSGLDRPVCLSYYGSKGLDIPSTTISKETLAELKRQGYSIIYTLPLGLEARPEITTLSPTAFFLDPADRFDKWNISDRFSTFILGADVSKEFSDATGSVYGGTREAGIRDGNVHLWAEPQKVIIVPPSVDLSN